LVKSPYRNPRRYYEDNSFALTPQVREHLRRYDRFYIPSAYEENPVLDHFITYKLVVRYLAMRRQAQVHSSCVDNLFHESWRVTRKILERAEQLAGQKSAGFMIVILPVYKDISRAKRDPEFSAWWRTMVESILVNHPRTVDLMPTMLATPEDVLDTGYDGTHFGPRVSEIIAQAIGKNVLSSSSRSGQKE